MKPSVVFALVGLFIAFFLEHLPLPELLYWFKPEWVVLFVIMLIVLEPFKYAYGLVLPIGLLLDVEHSSVFGLHCFMLTLYVLLVQLMYRRFVVLHVIQQTVVIFFMVFIVQYVSYTLVDVFAPTPDISAWIPALSSAIVWPWLSVTSFWLFRQQSIKASST